MSENIEKHSFTITKNHRRKLKNHQSLVIWFTGLSGAGKSTLANALEEQLYNSGYHTYILDGDNLRNGLNADLGFSDKDRVENIRRVGEVSKLFIDSGTIVLASFISPFKEDRQKVRSKVAPDLFIEVFVNTPLDICEQRDTKGLYKKARKGEIKNFPGVNSIFEAPENPEVTINTNTCSIKEAVSQILKKTNLTLNANE